MLDPENKFERSGKPLAIENLWEGNDFFYGSTQIQGDVRMALNTRCTEGNCFDRLFGSKIMVANLELRFPLFQILGIGEGYYGVFPLDFMIFSDAGIAWMNEGDNQAWFLGGSRKPVFSAGIGVRMNLFGYVVLGVSCVKPFQRPDQAPYLQLTFTPGF